MENATFSLLTFEPDEFIRNSDTTRWTIGLSDGRFVTQDDDRPGAEPASTWLRLKEFLAIYPDLRVVDFHIDFRDHRVSLPANADGYYFAKSVRATYGVSAEHYTVGYLTDGIWSIVWYKVPELISTLEETRFDSEVNDKFVIRNP